MSHVSRVLMGGFTFLALVGAGCATSVPTAIKAVPMAQIPITENHNATSSQGWKEYVNSGLGISMSYPDYLVLEEATTSVSFIRMNPNNYPQPFLFIEKIKKTTSEKILSNIKKANAAEKVRERDPNNTNHFFNTVMPDITFTTLAGKRALKIHSSFEGEVTNIYLPEEGYVLGPADTLCGNECLYDSPPTTGPLCRDSCPDLEKMLQSIKLKP